MDFVFLNIFNLIIFFFIFFVCFFFLLSLLLSMKKKTSIWYSCSMLFCISIFTFFQPFLRHSVFGSSFHILLFNFEFRFHLHYLNVTYMFNVQCSCCSLRRFVIFWDAEMFYIIAYGWMDMENVWMMCLNAYLIEKHSPDRK